MHIFWLITTHRKPAESLTLSDIVSKSCHPSDCAALVPNNSVVRLPKRPKLRHIPAPSVRVPVKSSSPSITYITYYFSRRRVFLYFSLSLFRHLTGHLYRSHPFIHRPSSSDPRYGPFFYGLAPDSSCLWRDNT
jgi:hypothetical protein